MVVEVGKGGKGRWGLSGDHVGSEGQALPTLRSLCTTPRVCMCERASHSSPAKRARVTRDSLIESILSKSCRVPDD